MIDVPTLFILGAGASKPYGFPTGDELRTEIIKGFSADLERLMGSDPVPTTHHHKERIIESARIFVDHFKNSPITSIDKYLAFNPNFSRFGKFAIALYIRKKEKQIRLFEDLGDSDPQENWYRLIFNRMTSTLKAPEDFRRFAENKIAFITFNYDRSLEYFLYKWFLHTFWESRDKFRGSLSDYIPFPIIHVYGKVGELSWEPPYDQDSNYREEPVTFEWVKNLANGIRVIGEKSAEVIGEQIKALIEAKKRIFFLGFGYAKENLDEIGLPGAIDDKWKIFGTGKGMTKKEMGDVKSVLGKNYKLGAVLENWVRIEDRNSYDLLREYL